MASLDFMSSLIVYWCLSRDTPSKVKSGLKIRDLLFRCSSMFYIIYENCISRFLLSHNKDRFWQQSSQLMSFEKPVNLSFWSLFCLKVYGWNLHSFFLPSKPFTPITQQLISGCTFCPHERNVSQRKWYWEDGKTLWPGPIKISWAFLKCRWSPPPATTLSLPPPPSTNSASPVMHHHQHLHFHLYNLYCYIGHSEGVAGHRSSVARGKRCCRMGQPVGCQQEKYKHQ